VEKFVALGGAQFSQQGFFDSFIENSGRSISFGKSSAKTNVTAIDGDTRVQGTGLYGSINTKTLAHTKTSPQALCTNPTGTLMLCPKIITASLTITTSKIGTPTNTQTITETSVATATKNIPPITVDNGTNISITFSSDGVYCHTNFSGTGGPNGAFNTTATTSTTSGYNRTFTITCHGDGSATIPNITLSGNINAPAATPGTGILGGTGRRATSTEGCSAAARADSTTRGYGYQWGSTGPNTSTIIYDGGTPLAGNNLWWTFLFINMSPQRTYTIQVNNQGQIMNYVECL
jgi:hypothetical protein